MRSRRDDSKLRTNRRPQIQIVCRSRQSEIVASPKTVSLRGVRQYCLERRYNVRVELSSDCLRDTQSGNL